MKSLTLWVRQERKALYKECYEALGYTRVSGTREEQAVASETVFVREGEEPEVVENRRKRCESVLADIEAIDAKVERYYLERVVLVGLAGAACIGLSFLFLHLGWHIVFTLSLLVGLFGCTVTLALRPAFTRMGLKRFGGEVPELETKLRAIFTEKEGC